MDEVSWMQRCKWSPLLTEKERDQVTTAVKRWIRGEAPFIFTPRGVTVEIHPKTNEILAVAKRV